jgi:ribonuclease-3 family protein
MLLDLHDMGFDQMEKPGELPPLVLAYIGDAVYELAVRGLLVSNGRVNLRLLHQATVGYVNAAAQAKAFRQLEGTLTEAESAVARRGRNTKSNHVPRHGDMLDYRLSTAFECLIGYLYLKGDRERLAEVLGILLKQE